MLKVAIKTLGCKVNQYESYSIIEEFRANGFKVVNFEDSADVYIINTCAVTSMAEKKSRQMIRHVANKGFTIVTGCGVDADPGSYFLIEGVDLVVSNVYKDHIYKLFKAGERGIFTWKEWKRPYTYFDFPSYTEKTRAYIKIQDGCNRFCTYCKIPYLRGIERSRDPDDIFIELNYLLKKGFKEINLLGINLGSYNFRGYSLSDLLVDIEKIKGDFWIRLSSIEPEDVESLLPLLENPKKLVPHLHIPLQSGDNYILKKMHRGYTGEFYKNVVKRIRREIPEISVTSDVIVGFPGEGIIHFNNTYKLLKELNIHKFHIFSYSKRAGTAAYYMKDEVPNKEKSRRVNILKELRDELMKKYYTIFLDKRMKVLVEGRRDLYYGMSPYYFKVYLKEGSIKQGEFHEVCIKDLFKDGVLGEVCYNN